MKLSKGWGSLSCGRKIKGTKDSDFANKVFRTLVLFFKVFFHYTTAGIIYTLHQHKSIRIDLSTFIRLKRAANIPNINMITYLISRLVFLRTRLAPSTIWYWLNLSSLSF